MSAVINPISTPASSNTSTPNTTQPASTGVGDLANENTFLKLLIAQLQNQDPLNPADSIQFVTQLAQFSQLEQSTQMVQDLDAIKQALTGQAPAPSGTSPTTGGN